jgi:hypothetical protein
MQLDKLENRHVEVDDASIIPPFKVAPEVRSSRPDKEHRSVNKPLPSPRKQLGPLSATKELAQFDINNETPSYEYQTQGRGINSRLNQDYSHEDQDRFDEFDGEATRPQDWPKTGTEA